MIRNNAHDRDTDAGRSTCSDMNRYSTVQVLRSVQTHMAVFRLAAGSEALARYIDIGANTVTLCRTEASALPSLAFRGQYQRRFREVAMAAYDCKRVIRQTHDAELMSIYTRSGVSSSCPYLDDPTSMHYVSASHLEDRCQQARMLPLQHVSGAPRAVSLWDLTRSRTVATKKTHRSDITPDPGGDTEKAVRLQ